MAATNKNSAAKARVVQAQGKALELRRAGYSYTKIAEALGCTLSSAHGYVKSAMAEALEQVQADANELRAEEVSRLDGMLSGLWPKARKGNLAEVDRVLKIMERRAKLLGLDRPQRIALGGDGDSPPIHSLQQLQNLSDDDLERIAAAGRSA